MNKVMHKAYLGFIPICIISLLSIIGITLSSSTVSAGTEVVDTIALTVPIACTMSGTGTTHTATLSPGTYSGTSGSEYENGIGKTTLTAICNDDNGFAIYAVGYTGNQSGVTNLVGEETSGTIATKAYASGDTTSNWSMKLTKVDNPVSGDPVTYNPQNLTLTTGYNTWHAVPDTLTKVAEYKANTGSSTTDTTLGVKLETTYAAFIASNQPADTYIGQVKYIMVHPYYVDKSALEDAITVVFDGNGLTFPNGSTTNTVKYANVCEPGEYAYVGNTYQEVMTSNITTGGTQNGGYTDHESILQSITLPGADKVKVVVDYAITGGTIGVDIVGGDWDGDFDNWDPDWVDYQIYDSERNISRTEAYIFDGDTVTIYSESWASPESDYNKGFYARIYPIYDTEQANTTYEELPSSDCSIIPISGTYAETTTEWRDKWTTTIEGTEMVFEPIRYEWGDQTTQETFLEFIKSHYYLLKGTSLTLYAYNPVTFDEVYASANKTKLNGYYKIQDLNASMCIEVSEDEITTVIDVRDNNTYSIGKLSNGSCWLLDNLRLNPLDPTTAANMSASNTNASDDAIYNYLHGGNPNNIAGWTSTAVSSPSDWQPYNTYSIPYFNVSNNESYGVYYNFCAASAGTYCYNQDSSGSFTYDICPANWKLPTNHEVNAVPSHSGSLHLTLSGNYDPGSSTDETDKYENLEDKGFYWTSTRSNSIQINTYMIRRPNYYYEWAAGAFLPNTYRTEGNSIRCILSFPLQY